MPYFAAYNKSVADKNNIHEWLCEHGHNKYNNEPYAIILSTFINSTSPPKLMVVSIKLIGTHLFVKNLLGFWTKFSNNLYYPTESIKQGSSTLLVAALSGIPVEINTSYLD